MKTATFRGPSAYIYHGQNGRKEGLFLPNFLLSLRVSKCFLRFGILLWNSACTSYDSPSFQKFQCGRPPTVPTIRIPKTDHNTHSHGRKHLSISQNIFKCFSHIIKYFEKVFTTPHAIHNTSHCSYIYTHTHARKNIIYYHTYTRSCSYIHIYIILSPAILKNDSSYTRGATFGIENPARHRFE